MTPWLGVIACNCSSLVSPRITPENAIILLFIHLQKRAKGDANASFNEVKKS